MKKVLIIDDEVDLCVMIKQFLTRKQYSVQIAHTLKDGFQFLNTEVPDALILDNNLPDGMGWDAVESIHEKYPQIKITLMSAYRLPKDFRTGLDKSITILEKPVSLLDIEQFL